MKREKGTLTFTIGNKSAAISLPADPVEIDSASRGIDQIAMNLLMKKAIEASAINVPVTGLVDETGHFRPLDELAAMHDIDPDARVITYCGGGIAASSNAFVMTRLGFTDVAVYTASLQEWAADPDLPMEVATP